jgi:hypothetical protein
MRVQLLLALGGILLLAAPARAQELKGAATRAGDPIRVEARGALRLEEDIQSDFDALRNAYPKGTGAYLAGGGIALELYLGGDKAVLGTARELKGKAVVVSGTPLYVFPPEGLQRLSPVTLPPRLVIRVTGIKAAAKE